MFCRDCLLSEFGEQLTRMNKQPVQVSMFKKAGESVRPKVEGGSCPVCHDWVKTSSLVQIEKSEDGKTISKHLKQLPESEKENSPNANAEALHRDALARDTLESALNGASSAKLDAVLAELDKVWTSDPGSKVLIFSQVCERYYDK